MGAALAPRMQVGRAPGVPQPQRCLANAMLEGRQEGTHSAIVASILLVPIRMLLRAAARLVWALARAASIASAPKRILLQIKTVEMCAQEAGAARLAWRARGVHCRRASPVSAQPDCQNGPACGYRGAAGRSRNLPFLGTW